MQVYFRFFLIPYMAVVIVGLIVIGVTNHGDTVLWLNSIHNDFLNQFFKIWTHGGDGIFYGVVALGLIIYKRRYGFIFALVGIAYGLVSAFMKRVLFKGVPRPRKYFEGTEALDLIAGVKVHDFNSFPSGHTMTAFAMAAFLSIMLQSRAWSFGLFLFATLVGISRMYLNQHFLVDVIAGSLIGVVLAIVIYKAFEKYLTR